MVMKPQSHRIHFISTDHALIITHLNKRENLNPEVNAKRHLYRCWLRKTVFLEALDVYSIGHSLQLYYREPPVWSSGAVGCPQARRGGGGVRDFSDVTKNGPPQDKLRGSRTHGESRS